MHILIRNDHVTKVLHKVGSMDPFQYYPKVTPWSQSFFLPRLSKNEISAFIHFSLTMKFDFVKSIHIILNPYDTLTIKKKKNIYKKIILMTRHAKNVNNAGGRQQKSAMNIKRSM